MMAHQMTIELNDDEYAELIAQAERSGRPIESVAHDLLTQRLGGTAAASPSISSSQFTRQQYREGKILNLPTRASLTAEEAVERARRAHLLGRGKNASEMVIEDRGPR